MARRKWFLAYVGLLGTVGVLAFPGSSSALLGFSQVNLSSTGPSPAGLTIGVIHGPVMFTNTDTVTHTVTFDDSSCSGDVAPGKGLLCAVPEHIGSYAYTVDGTTKARVKVTPEFRQVTLGAKRHGVRAGSRFVLHGTLKTVVAGAPPTLFGPRMPVTVYARPQGHRFWFPIATVMSKPLKKAHSASPYSVWHVSVRPHGNTTYRVVAKSGLQLWQRAQSKPFGVFVRRR